MAALTSLGWLIALPIVIGVLTGRWIDGELDTGFVATLALLGAGIGIGATEAWLLVRATLKRQTRDASRPGSS